MNWLIGENVPYEVIDLLYQDIILYEKLVEFGELGVRHLMKQSIPITATYCANLPHCLARFLFWLVSARMNYFSDIILVHAFLFGSDQWFAPYRSELFPPQNETKLAIHKK